MKNIIKKYYPLIIIFLFLITIFGINAYKYLKNENNLEKIHKKNLEICTEEPISSDMIEFCESVKKEPTNAKNFYNMLYYTHTSGYDTFGFFLFLFIIVQSNKIVCRFFKNNGLKNSLTRQSYRKTISKLFLDAYKSAFIFPLITIIAFIVCYLATGTFNYGNMWQKSTMNNPSLFMFTYLLKIIIISLLYVNINLLVCRKNHNFIISMIKSYLVFIGLEIFLEIIVSMLILHIIFKTEFGLFLNIISIFTLYDNFKNGLFYSIIIPLIFLVISTFILYKAYKNKEKLIIECEKNS